MRSLKGSQARRHNGTSRIITYDTVGVGANIFLTSPQTERNSSEGTLQPPLPIKALLANTNSPVAPPGLNSAPSSARDRRGVEFVSGRPGTPTVYAWQLSPIIVAHELRLVRLLDASLTDRSRSRRWHRRKRWRGATCAGSNVAGSWTKSSLGCRR